MGDRHLEHLQSPQLDAIHPGGKAVAQIQFSVDAVRSVRTALLDLTIALSRRTQANGYLVLVDPTVTPPRIAEEWKRIQSVIRRDLSRRLAICVLVDGRWSTSVPTEPSPQVRQWIIDVAEAEKQKMPRRGGRSNFAYVIQKLLLYQSMVLRRPVKISWLSRTAGCSYPTVAKVLHSLASLVDRPSDRRVSLRVMPDPELVSLLSLAERSRSTMRFTDRSGQPRAPEQHVRRLERLNPKGVALGGPMAARHYLPRLDLIGTPRLDLSVHALNEAAVVELLHTLDPALEPEHDPRRPANVVVHSVRQSNPLFEPRASGLSWADPIECLFDLHEARLQAQAREYTEALRKGEIAIEPIP